MKHYLVPLALIFILLSIAAYPQDANSVGTIFVVRHAEKQSDAADTPLSNKGHSRAACLAQTLRDSHIGAILTTQYIRTQQTAAPTAREANVSPRQLDAKSTQETVSDARLAAAKGNVLIVGHSNTVPALLTAFGAPVVTIPDSSYDQLFIFNVGDPKKLLQLHYCPTLSTDDTPHPANSMAKP
jgi:phosphohistidine phosphatase SixA